MNFLKTSLSLIILLGTTLVAEAVPAYRGLITVSQPDGTTLRVRMVGDEYLHFIVDEDGFVLHQDNNGLYTFAEIDESGLVVTTGVKATEKAAAKKVKFNDLNIQKIADLRDIETRRAQSIPGAMRPAASDRSRAPQTGMGCVSSTYPRTGNPKGLIILVSYSDVDFTLTNAKDYFNDLINGANFTQYGGTGSALEYFSEQSHGNFIPSFDVLGPVKLPNTRSYYGANDRDGNDVRPHMMVIDAIRQLDATIDFSKYDTDGDGLIDNVYVFYAGAGEADGGAASTVWPHSWDVRYGGQNLVVDGVRVAHYACSNEWSTYTRTPDGIGTFVHEFSHVMGLPDLYHTTAYANYTPHDYTVLDYGCYNNNSRTPPFYTAYERNAMGWEEPRVITGPASVELNPIENGGFVLIPTEKETEFFLMENRQKTGWDKYLPGHGLLIWHIDYEASVFGANVVNNNKSHQYVDLIEANNNINSDSDAARAGWPFPGTSRVTSFTSSTKPSFVSWSGRDLNLPITNITETNGIITFDVAGGKIDFETPTPVVASVDGNSRSFVATWEPIDGATDYLLTVYAVGNAPGGTITNGFDGATLGDGWTASASSSSDFYDVISFCGESKPSYKFSVDGQTLTSPKTDSNILSVQFWTKGQTLSGSTLTVEGLVNGEWKTISIYTPLNLREDTPTFDNIPEGCRQLRFTYNKTSGSLAFDDVVITHGGGGEVLSDYNGVSTNGATSVKVDKLLDNTDDYYFTVKAIDGDLRSLTSEPVFVSLNGNAGVGDIFVDNDSECSLQVQYFNLLGMPLDKPVPGTIVIRKQGKNTSKVIIR